MLPMFLLDNVFVTSSMPHHDSCAAVTYQRRVLRIVNISRPWNA